MSIPLPLVVVVPVAMMLAAGLSPRLGLGRFAAVTVVVLSLIGAGLIWLSGLRATCGINESECLGATATTYLVGLFWLMAFATSIISISRTKAVGNNSESGN
ncbi:hypothetical protein [Mesorhizobium sp. YM1C-6-2]|uniref:hypothetical protein n=1 Tax=Mesorhizobium sp. YM1C-6-2 TaxID=1827501 RepID=UPI0011C3B794|nr:hypothetical protein [Mesorhizobium sp. YM1C-6-2]